MSGSPPPEQPAEPPQIAGRRRKRSHTPPPTSAAVVPSPLTPLEHTAPRSGAQARGGETIGELPVPPGPYVPHFALPGSYQATSGLPTVSVGGPEPRYAPTPISPRATRKPKAHVASACINCKKKHLRCDNSRPCRRCVQSGKEVCFFFWREGVGEGEVSMDMGVNKYRLTYIYIYQESCVDVEHKKRGRPPLKPEDPSVRRPFESAISPLTGQLGDPHRRNPGSDPSAYMQSTVHQRNIRPFPPYDPSRSQLRGPAFQPMYAPPSISPSPAMAIGTFVPSTRPYPAGPMSISGQLSSYSPSYSSGHNYQLSQGSMGPPSQFTYSNPIFPRPPASSPLPPETLPPMQDPSNLQLPPIRPAPFSPGLIDPSISQQPARSQSRQSGRSEQDSRDDGTQERDSKRPKMDIQSIIKPHNK